MSSEPVFSLLQYHTALTVAVWLSGSSVAYINQVTLRKAGLVLGLVTIDGYTILIFKFNQTPRPTQPGHPLWVGEMSTGESRPLL